MKKYEFTGKTYEEALENAKISLQELEDNLIIKEKEVKSSLFNKKVVIEVMRKEEINDYIKSYTKELLRNIGINANIEFKKRGDSLNATIYSDNDNILIGKNGKNIDSLINVVRQVISTEVGERVKINIDINDYKDKRQENLVRAAKQVAKEVSKTKIEAKLDPMNSYERRLVHEALKGFKDLTSDSVGEEPNRCIVIKVKED